MSVIAHIYGGLGNQMFQYALGRAISLCYSVPFLLDLSWFALQDGGTPRRFHLDVFPQLTLEKRVWSEATLKDVRAVTRVALWRRIAAKVFRYPQLCLSRVVREVQIKPYTLQAWLKPPLYLEGYWQDERYFSASATVIKQDFLFPTLSSEAKSLAETIKALPHAVAVHVRRGDYVTNLRANEVHGLCSSEYYAAAIVRIKSDIPNAHLFLFSDDPVWVRANFALQGLPATVVDMHGEHDAHHDMHLMTLCKHHVIANSSFSWWGAWLAVREGITIAPARWFADISLEAINPSPSRWIKF